MNINSLASWRCSFNRRLAICKLISRKDIMNVSSERWNYPQVNATRPHWLLVNIGSCSGLVQSATMCYMKYLIWVRSRMCGCLVTWFCYQLIAKPGNKTATPSWPDPYHEILNLELLIIHLEAIYGKENMSEIKHYVLCVCGLHPNGYTLCFIVFCCGLVQVDFAQIL